jgi:WD40 repeat protein
MNTIASRIVLIIFATMLVDSAATTQTAGTGPSLDSLWSNLADADAAKAYRAIWTLALSPEQSVPFLKSKLKPLPASEKEILRLIDDLDSQTFATRAKAETELERLADGALAALEKALKGNPSLEAKRRIEQILKRIPDAATIPAFVQQVRGLEVLELAGTPSALELLQELGKGNASARFTQIAQQSHARAMARKKLSPPDRPTRRFDADGDPLPAGTLARLGTTRLQNGDLAVLTPDGKTLVTANANLLQAWDLTTGRALPGFPQHKDWSQLRAIAISPDGKLLAVAHLEGNLIDFCLFPSGALLHRNLLTSEFIIPWGRSATFSSDSKAFFVATNKTLHVWDAVTGQKIREFKHSKQQAATLLSPGGKWLATCDNNYRNVDVWDVDAGKLAHELGPQHRPWLGAVFSSDGAMLAMVGPGPSVRIWDTAAGKIRREIPIAGDTVSGDPAPSFTFSPDGASLALTTCVRNGTSEQRIELWNLLDTNHKPRTIQPPPGIGWIEAITNDGKSMLCRNGISFNAHGNSFRLLDEGTGKDRHGWAFRGGISSITYSADQKLIATGIGDGTVCIWDRANAQLLRTMFGHRYAVRQVAFSPDAKLLVSCSDIEPAVLWDVAKGTKRTQFDNSPAHFSGVKSAGFTSDGQQVMVRGDHRKLRFFDAETANLIRQMSYSDDGSRSVVWSPEHYLLVAGNRAAFVTDTKNDKLVFKFAIKGEMVQSAFSPDGRNLAALICRDDVIVWDMLTSTFSCRWFGIWRFFQ